MGDTVSDRPRTGTRARAMMTLLAALSLAAVAMPALARLLGWEAGPLAYVLALMPWVAVASLVPLALALLARAWRLAILAAAVASLCWWWQAPLLTTDAVAVDDALRVATLNLTFGRAEAAAVVELARAHDLDLLALQELTPDAEAALREEGLDSLLPYSEVRAEEGFTGTGLWSRRPLTEGRAVPGYTSQVVVATVGAPGAGRTVIVAHPMAPGIASNRLWRTELDTLSALVESAGPQVVVLGDLNASRDHRGLRAWEARSCADAADQAGAGFVPTFPEGRGPFPVAAIDHVYTCESDLRATAVRSVSVAGADHRALVVTFGTT